MAWLATAYRDADNKRTGEACSGWSCKTNQRGGIGRVLPGVVRDAGRREDMYLGAPHRQGHEPRDPRHTIRIGFVRDEEGGRVVVGFICQRSSETVLYVHMDIQRGSREAPTSSACTSETGSRYGTGDGESSLWRTSSARHLQAEDELARGGGSRQPSVSGPAAGPSTANGSSAADASGSSRWKPEATMTLSGRLHAHRLTGGPPAPTASTSSAGSWPASSATPAAGAGSGRSAAHARSRCPRDRQPSRSTVARRFCRHRPRSEGRFRECSGGSFLRWPWGPFHLATSTHPVGRSAPRRLASDCQARVRPGRVLAGGRPDRHRVTAVRQCRTAPVAACGLSAASGSPRRPADVRPRVRLSAARSIRLTANRQAARGRPGAVG